MGYTVHGILQARILEWAVFPFSRGSSWPRNRTRVYCIAGGFFTNWAIREALAKQLSIIITKDTGTKTKQGDFHDSWPLLPQMDFKSLQKSCSLTAKCSLLSVYFVCLPRNAWAASLICFLFHSLPTGVNIFYEKGTLIYQNISSIIPGIHRQLVCSVKPCPSLRNPMDCSMPGFPVLDYLPENSCPLSLWCHPNISSSDISFSSCLQSFPASGPFPMSRFLASGSRSIGASVSASVLRMNIQD